MPSGPDSASSEAGFKMTIAMTRRERLRSNRQRLASYAPFLLSHKERRFQAYGVGLPRTGTHTLGDLFRANYRAEHEPNHVEDIANIVRWGNGELSDDRMTKVLVARDRILGLEMEASHYLHHVTPLLATRFPNAKFILTVREPVAWIESEVNQNFLTREANYWSALSEFRYARYDFEFESAAMEGKPWLYPVRSYLAYWKRHIETVMKGVAPENLLVVATPTLSQRLEEIAGFVGADFDLLDTHKHHTGKRAARVDLYDYVDREKVRSLVSESLESWSLRDAPDLQSVLT